MNVEGGKTYEPSPAGTLDAEGRSVELLLEVIEAAEGLLDGLLQGAVLELASGALALLGGRSEVGPEQGVVDVAYG